MNTLKPRNPFAHSPLLKKGGAHQRSQSSARFAGKQHLLAELDDYERDVLYPLATKQIAIDLDDGVKKNYLKFGTALKKIAGLDAKEED